MALKQTFGFLGAGRMATALAGGMVKASLIKSRQLVASDLVPAAAKAFAKTTGGKALKGNAEVVRAAWVAIGGTTALGGARSPPRPDALWSARGW